MKAKKLGVVDHAPDHFLRIVVLLPADRLTVVAGRGNHHEQRLPARAGRGLQHVPQIAVRLRMQFIDDNPACIQAMLSIRVGAEHAIAAACAWHIDRALVDLRAFLQKWRILDHALGFVEDDRGLVAVRRGAEYLRCRLILAEQQEIRDPRGQTALAVFARDLNISCAESSCAIGPFPAEERPDNLIALPGLQRERLPGPFAFTVAQQPLEEINRDRRGPLVKMEIRHALFHPHC